MKLFARRLLRFATAVALASSLAACSAAKWSEQADGSAEAPGSSGTSPEKGTKQFETTVRVDAVPAKPLDLVWVVDNSTSMDAEAAHVRSNLQTFAKYVVDRAEISFTLISRKGVKGSNVTLPLLTPNFSQINHFVWSTDALEILASSFCPETPIAATACGQIRAKPRVDELKNVAALLRPKLRTGAKKIFVVVTDDESRISSELFSQAFREEFPNEDFVAYGFVGFNKEQSACADKEGAQYQNLAKASSGEVFNVCDQDWSAHFQRLAELSVRQTVHPIVLPDEVVSSGGVVTVEVNGAMVPASLYTLTREGLVLDPQSVPKEGEYVVRVTYEVALP